MGEPLKIDVYRFECRTPRWGSVKERDADQLGASADNIKTRFVRNTRVDPDALRRLAIRPTRDEDLRPSDQTVNVGPSKRRTSRPRQQHRDALSDADAHGGDRTLRTLLLKLQCCRQREACP